LQIITGTLLHHLGPWTATKHIREWPAVYDGRRFCYILRDDIYWQYSRSRHPSQFTHGVPQPRWKPDPTKHIPITATNITASLVTIEYTPYPITPTPSVPETFEEYIASLPTWEQDLLQYIDLNLPPFEFLHRLSSLTSTTGPTLAVSDGSQVQDRIAFGWTIRDGEDIDVARSRSPGWGKATSHRAEAYGFLSVILFIERITTFCHWHKLLSFHFFSDNNGLISRAKQRISYGDILYPNETLRPDWDVVEQITSFIHHSIHHFTIDHVKGHQDDDRTLQRRQQHNNDHNHRPSIFRRSIFFLPTLSSVVPYE
jgi:hypothetical protein